MSYLSRNIVSVQQFHLNFLTRTQIFLTTYFIFAPSIKLASAPIYTNPQSSSDSHFDFSRRSFQCVRLEIPFPFLSLFLHFIVLHSSDVPLILWIVVSKHWDTGHYRNKLSNNHFQLFQSPKQALATALIGHCSHSMGAGASTVITHLCRLVNLAIHNSIEVTMPLTTFSYSFPYYPLISLFYLDWADRTIVSLYLIFFLSAPILGAPLGSVTELTEMVFVTALSLRWLPLMWRFCVCFWCTETIPRDIHLYSPRISKPGKPRSPEWFNHTCNRALFEKLGICFPYPKT